MRQVLRPMMVAVILLKTIVIASLLSAVAIALATYDANAQSRIFSSVQCNEIPASRSLKLPDPFNGKRNLNSKATLALVQELAASSRTSFDLGFAFVRAMYFASLSDVDQEAHEKAILELVHLIDRLEDQPDQSAQLQRVLQMVTRSSGTGIERWEAVQRAINSYSQVLKGDTQWYFNSAVAISKLFVATYLNDPAAMRSELQNLQWLTRIAPQSVPRDVLVPMQSLLRYYYQTTFTESDRAALIEAVDKIIVTATT